MGLELAAAFTPQKTDRTLIMRSTCQALPELWQATWFAKLTSTSLLGAA